MFKIDRKGATRIVFIFKRFVIKIPSLKEHRLFLHGCCANWNERSYTKSTKGLSAYYTKIAPTYFSSWFGLLTIQKRALPKEENLTEKEIEYFQYITTDIKKENFGYIDKKLVCLDYG